MGINTNNMGATFVITAALMTYDIKQKYCHAVGNITATQDKLRFSCQDLRAYFAGDKILTLKRIEARQKVRMHYVTTKNKITITGPRAHFENREVVFTHNPHVKIVILDKGTAHDRGSIHCSVTKSSNVKSKHPKLNTINGSSIAGYALVEDDA